MTTQTILPNANLPKYYSNCRGVNYLPIMMSEWEKSGFLPRYPLNSVFGVLNPSLVFAASESFQGTNKTSQWWYYNHNDNEHCVNLLRGMGINAIRVFLDVYVWERDRTRFLSNLKDFMKICDKYKIRVQLVIWDGVQIPDTDVITNRSLATSALEFGLLTNWAPSPQHFEVSSVSQAQNFYTTCAVPYLADLCSSVSSFQSLWSFDLVNEENRIGYSSLASSTSIYLSGALSSLGVGITFGHGATYDQYSGTLYGGINTVYPNVITKLSSIINFASLHIYQVNSYAISRDIVNEAISGHTHLGLPSMYSEGSNSESLNWNYKNVEYFNSSLNYGGLLFDGLIDFANSIEPFRDAQGILFWDGTVRNSKEPRSFVSLAQSCGWMKGIQLNRDIQQKNISNNSGIDGGYWSGTIPEHLGFNPTLYVSTTEAKWVATKNYIYNFLPAAGVTKNESSKNYTPYINHPMAYGYGLGYAVSSLELKDLVTICSSYSTYFPPLSSYSNSLSSGSNFLKRNSELHFRDFILYSLAKDLLVTIPQTRADIIGTQWDKNLIPSSIRLDFSSHYFSASRVDGSSIDLSIDVAAPTITSASFPCNTNNSCLYVTPGNPNSGISWSGYDTWYTTAFTNLNTCLNFYLSSTYNNRLY